LQRHQLRQLRQRIMFRCRLPLLSSEQTGDYVTARLFAAGANTAESRLFPRETIRVLHSYSRGIPRVINLLCEHALLAAYSEKHRSISAVDIHAAAAKFDLAHDPIPAEEVFPMSTKMALFLSPDPPVAEESLQAESRQAPTQQLEQQTTQQTSETLPVFPVPAPVPMTTETILSLTLPSAGEPELARQPIGDPPVEDVAAEMATPLMNSALANPASDFAPEASVPGVSTTRIEAPAGAIPALPAVSIPRKVVFGPKRMATAMERQAAEPTPAAPTAVASIRSQVTASNTVTSPNPVSNASAKLIEPEKVVSAKEVTPLKPQRVESEFAPLASKDLAEPKVQHEVSHRLTAVPAQVSSAPKKQAPTTKPVSQITSQITVQLAAASKQLATASRQVAAASKQIAVASKQLASASKRILPPNFVASIVRYCRSVADSFVRDLRSWIKPLNGTRPANPQPIAATDSSQAVPPKSSATPPNAVVSISKWLHEPMAPSLQAHAKPNSSRKARRARQANKQAPRSAQKS
jgi:hypothetical protein